MPPPAAHPFSVGDRVVYRDPEDPRNPLIGEVVEVTGHAVSVRYDDHPPTARPGLIAVEHVAEVLRPEETDALTRAPYRPGYWTGGRS